MSNVDEDREDDRAEEFNVYRKTAVQLMRPYIEGEDMIGISVALGDTPEVGEMIAVNNDDFTDIWYVSKKFFEANYEII